MRATRWLLGLLILVLLGGAYILVVLNWSYSQGDRAGWVQRLDRKGWVCKTWEGELALVSMPGTTPEKFYFTVWDDKVATDIQAEMGKRVSLNYEVKVGLPTTCFGETRSYVTSVRRQEEVSLIPGVTIPVAPAASAASHP